MFLGLSYVSILSLHIFFFTFWWLGSFENQVLFESLLVANLEKVSEFVL